jgi:hypothetical protein
MANEDLKASSKAYLDAEVSKKILGMPPWFTYETDPSGRVYTRCLAHNAPILVITPGLPDFSPRNKTEEESTQSRLLEIQNEIKKSEGSRTTAEATALDSKIQFALENTLKNMQDDRYYRFSPTPKEYLYILNSMMTRMNTRLDTKNFKPEAVSLGDGASWYGLNIYCTNKTSISESASNEYGDSMLEAVQSGLGDKMKEIWFAFDAMVGTDSKEETSAISNGEGIDSALGGLMKGASSTIAGEKLMLPKIWKNSSFDKSYSLDFEFQSIYGDIPTIFEQVFKPYLALLALALPRQTGLSSFKNPFLVRIESPGWFNIECGVIDSIQITRAPDPDDWSKDGLCKKIKVTMSVRDIYPSLMLSYSTSALNTNIGMAEYLDSLAGLTIRDQQLVNIKRAMSDYIGGGLGAIDSYLQAKQLKAKEVLDRLSGGYFT